MALKGQVMSAYALAGLLPRTCLPSLVLSAGRQSVKLIPCQGPGLMPWPWEPTSTFKFLSFTLRIPEPYNVNGRCPGELEQISQAQPLGSLLNPDPWAHTIYTELEPLVVGPKNLHFYKTLFIIFHSWSVGRNSGPTVSELLGS